MILYNLTITIPFNDLLHILTILLYLLTITHQSLKSGAFLKSQFPSKIKKAATTALKSVPRLPLYLLKQLFFTYIAPFLYEIRGLYVGIGGNDLPMILLTELIHGSYLCIDGFASLIVTGKPGVLCYFWYTQHVTTSTGR